MILLHITALMNKISWVRLFETGHGLLSNLGRGHKYCKNPWIIPDEGRCLYSIYFFFFFYTRKYVYVYLIKSAYFNHVNWVWALTNTWHILMIEYNVILFKLFRLSQNISMWMINSTFIFKTLQWNFIHWNYF